VPEPFADKKERCHAGQAERTNGADYGPLGRHQRARSLLTPRAHCNDDGLAGICMGVVHGFRLAGGWLGNIVRRSPTRQRSVVPLAAEY
jgi:hypothetical protein